MELVDDSIETILVFSQLPFRLLTTIRGLARGTGTGWPGMERSAKDRGRTFGHQRPGVDLR